MNRFFLFLMAAFYVAAGINHLWQPKMYLSIMPPYIPYQEMMVGISGVIEIVLGMLLLYPSTRSLAAWGIIILLIAVFPANIQMAINWQESNHPNVWIAIVRLPLQLLLIWWAYQYINRKHRGA